MTDYVLGQKIGTLWSYPSYTTSFDWLKLYLIIYPFGGLSVLELSLFFGNLFKEKLTLAESSNHKHFLMHILRYLVNLFLILIFLGLPLLYVLKINLPFKTALIYGMILWIITATITLAYHIRHGWHWISIFVSTAIMSIFLHEIPNTAVFEWKYYDAPILNYILFNIPLWVYVGWYFIVVIMFKVWLVLMRRD